MLGNGLAILADDDAVGIGPHIDRPADGARIHAVVVIVEAHQASLGNPCLDCYSAQGFDADRRAKSLTLLDS